MFKKTSGSSHLEAVACVEKIINSGVKKSDVVLIQEALGRIPLSDLKDPKLLDEIAASLSSVRGKLSYSGPHKRARGLIENSVIAVQKKMGELQKRAGGVAGAVDSSGIMGDPVSYGPTGSENATGL